MTQRTMSKTLARMLALCLMLTLALSMMASGAYAANDRTAKARIPTEDALHFDIRLTNCTVSIEPTDEKYAECWFDTGALKIQQEIKGQTVAISLTSISGKQMGYDAMATLYLPREGFNSLSLLTRNADVMLMEGIRYMQSISLDKSQASIQYTDVADNAYILDMNDSTCTFAFPETATGYKIKATVEKGQITVPAGGMPEYKGGGTYEYISGTASTVITAMLKGGSNLNFAFIRKAD